MTSPGQVMIGSYDHFLVILSILIAILASYTALDLAGRVTASRGWARLWWLTGGALSMGIGIWSMHYTGMLAFSLPVPVQYDWPTTLLSLLAGIFYSAVALFAVSRPVAGLLRAWPGSVFMGAAIVTLHYTGMESMRLAGMCRYSPTLVSLSVVLAVMGSLLSLWLAFHFRHEVPGRRLRKAASTLLMGAAIVSMHYTAMAAASFTRTDMVPDLSHSVSVSSLGIAGIGGVSAMVLVVTLVTSLVDRLQQQRTLLDELFEQMPQAVALRNADRQIVRVNREFTRIFGYSVQEAAGRQLCDLIVPGGSHDEGLGHWELAIQGQRVDVEGVRKRKDGSLLHVSLVLVPFITVPGGELSIYAIYSDITERKGAEEALRASEERWRAIFENSAVGIALTDSSGVLIATNRAFQEMVGYTDEELKAMSFMDITYEEDRGTNRELADELWEGKRQQFQYEKRYRRKDGALIWVRVTSSLAPSTEAVPPFGMGIVEEITERKRAEEELRRSEDRLRLSIDTIPTMAWTHRPDGALDFVNKRWRDYTGITSEEGIEKPTGVMHPEELPDVMEKWRADLAAGQPFEHEIRLRRADGEYRWCLVRTVPLRDELGNIVKWFGTGTEIEDRKQAEDALRRSFDELRGILEQLQRGEAYLNESQRLSHVGSWAVNISPREIVFWSQEHYRIFGFDAEAGIPPLRTVLERIHPEDRPKTDLAFESAIRERRDIENDFRIVLPDGTIKYCHSIGHPVVNESGELIEFIGTVMDVTESKRAEQELMHSFDQLRALAARLQNAREEERTRIAREIHDELGQALTAIKIDLAALIRELPGGSAAQLQRSQSILKLLDEAIQSVRRIATELRPGVLDDLGLAAAVEWAAEEFQARTGTNCEVSLPGVDIALDPERATALFRVLQETLTNIARHANATRVDVRLAQENQNLILEIHDNGQGIGEEHLSESRSLGILGMRERALLLGGELTISGEPGKGTTVRVRIPQPNRKEPEPGK
jgi:PAS domain S-box-containing protein